MAEKLKWIVPSALLVLGVVFVATHLGAYPQLADHTWFRVLAVFVAVNTIGFAALSVIKLGYRLGLTSGAQQ